MVLIDFVKQSSIADLKQARRRFAVPAGFLQRGSNCTSLRFALDALDQRLKRPGARRILLRFVRFRVIRREFRSEGDGMWIGVPAERQFQFD